MGPGAKSAGGAVETTNDSGSSSMTTGASTPKLSSDDGLTKIDIATAAWAAMMPLR
jgi:hypothetical protein